MHNLLTRANHVATSSFGGLFIQPPKFGVEDANANTCNNEEKADV